MGGLSDIFGGGGAPQVDLIEFGDRIGPSAIAEGIGPSELPTAIGPSAKPTEIGPSAIAGGIDPTAIPGTFGGQALGQAIGTGADIQGQAIQDAIASQQAGLGQAGQLFGQTSQQFDPFVSGGGQAFQSQAALSGALGPEAEKRALAGVQTSAGQQFLQDRAQRALLRNAAATGDLGGGRTKLALQEQAIGFGAQDIDRQFQRLGQVSQQGLSATGQLGGFRQGLGQAGIAGAQNVGNLQVLGGGVAAGGLTGAAEALRQEAGQQFGAGQAQFGQQTQQQQIANQANQVRFNQLSQQQGALTAAEQTEFNQLSQQQAALTAASQTQFNQLAQQQGALTAAQQTQFNQLSQQQGAENQFRLAQQGVEFQNAQAAAAAKAQGLGNILGVVGAGAGFALGGVPGAKVGASLGG